MQDFLHVRTVNELNQALSRQRALTRQALVELDAISERMLPRSLAEASELEMEEAWLAFKREEIRLLERYAGMPTLTEFEQMPGLTGLAKEGGTFGVAALVGEVVLSIILSLEPQFARIHRLVLMLLLRELDSPTPADEDLVDTVLRFVTIELKDSDTLGEATHHALRRGIVRPMVEAMLMATEEYAMVESPDHHGFILTSLGKRTMLHMFDSQRFVEAITAAHRRLQKPKD